MGLIWWNLNVRSFSTLTTFSFVYCKKATQTKTYSFIHVIRETNLSFNTICKTIPENEPIYNVNGNTIIPIKKMGNFFRLRDFFTSIKSSACCCTTKTQNNMSV